MPFGHKRKYHPPITERGPYRIRMVAAREQVNLSQAELAKKVNMSRSRIATIESGFSDPTLRDAVEIANVLMLENIKDMLELFEFTRLEKGGWGWVGNYGSIIKIEGYTPE